MILYIPCGPSMTDYPEIGHLGFLEDSEGQLISKCPYEKSVLSKIPTKKFPRFLPQTKLNRMKQNGIRPKWNKTKM